MLSCRPLLSGLLPNGRWGRYIFMIRQTPHVTLFQQQLRDALQLEAAHNVPIPARKGANIYVCGDPDETVYFIESGQVKLVMLSPEGHECLLSIHTAGDIFGELCLAGLTVRHETATAMTEVVLRPISCVQFLARLGNDALLIGFIQYLSVRIADQQDIIANLVTIDSEHRLGQTLLDLAHKLGKQDPRSIRIEQRITHEEFATMIGTTRPRVSEFMRRFRELGLIELNAQRHVIVKEGKLTAYLESIR